MYPRDFAAPTNLSVYYLFFGQFEKAVDEAREANRRDPNVVFPYMILGHALIGLNRFVEAKEIFEQALQHKLDGTRLRAGLYQIAFINGDTAAMQQQLDWARGKRDEYVAHDWQAGAAAFAGRERNAQHLSRLSIELAIHNDAKEVAGDYAAEAALRSAAFGQCAPAKTSAEQSFRLAPKDSPPWYALLALAWCGEGAPKQQLMDDYARRYPKDTVVNNLWLPTIRAAIELQRGNAAQALEQLQTTSSYEAAGEFWPQYLRGQACLKLNRGTEAAAQFQKILDHRGEAPLSALYALAHLGLARAAVLQGDPAKARKEYQDFFALWKDADADIPILIEAKKEYEKLR